MRAVTEVVPLSSPMVSVAYTLFLVPAKLAPIAFAIPLLAMLLKVKVD